MTDLRVDSVKTDTLQQSGVLAQSEGQQREAILTLKVKDAEKGVKVKQGMSREEVLHKMEELNIKTVAPENITNIKTAEDGKYVTFHYCNGSSLTMERANNREDVKASMELSKEGFEFNIQGSNAVFYAGGSVKNINIGINSSNLTIDTSNGTATNINLPRFASSIANIKIIPDKDVKKDTITLNVGMFKGDSGFLWHNKTQEISKETFIF